jgi:uncharacterized Tic20 family protein
MTDPAQPSGWGTEVPAWAEGAPVVPRGLQEHHESWTLGQPLPAEPALMTDGSVGTGTAGGPANAARPGRLRGWFEAATARLDHRGPGAPAGPDGRTGPRPASPVAVTSAPANAAAGDADLTGAQAGIARPHGTGGQVVPDRDDRWAMACYLGAIFFWLLAPLVIYLIRRNHSLFVRMHAAQAFNLTLTATLFAISGGIVAGVLALDSPRVALFVMGPVLLAFWIVVLAYVIRAASSASRDEFYEIPGWICVPALH